MKLRHVALTAFVFAMTFAVFSCNIAVDGEGVIGSAPVINMPVVNSGISISDIKYTNGYIALRASGELSGFVMVSDNSVTRVEKSELFQADGFVCFKFAPKETGLLNFSVFGIDKDGNPTAVVKAAIEVK